MRVSPKPLLPLSLAVVIAIAIFAAVQSGQQKQGRGAPPPQTYSSAPIPHLLAENYLASLPLKDACQTPSNPLGRRVILLGFDGLTSQELDPLLRAGKLPHFAQVIQGGAYGPLPSSIIPSSSVAWTTMMTGQEPGKTGLYSFFLPQPDYSFRLITSRLRRAKALWEIASETGKRVLVVNEPISAPPDEVNGIMVGGMLSPPGEPFTFPPSLSKPLLDLGYRTSYRHLKARKGAFEDPFGRPERDYDVTGIAQLERNTEQLVLGLMRSCAWDLLVGVFTMPDRLQHNRQALGDEPIEETYRLMDAFLGDVLKELHQDDLLICVSDHGFQWYDRGFFLSKWLKDSGLMELQEGKVVWERTRLFPVDTVGNYAIFRVNQQGREERGTVPPEQRTALLAQAKGGLLAIKDPSTGKSVVRSVWTGEELYGQGSAGEVPDLILELQPGWLAIRDLNFPPIVLTELPERVFDHRREGMAVFYQPGWVRKGVPLEAALTDIAPTVLAALLNWAPEGMAGRLLYEVFVPAHAPGLERKPFDLKRQKPGFSEEAGQTNPEVLENLKSLGYMK